MAQWDTCWGEVSKAFCSNARVRGRSANNEIPSWNKDLAYQRAMYLGGEFRAKGVNVALGPVVGPLGRVAEGGRNWEGFSNDPYLCGALAYQTVTGIQSQGVITSTKVSQLHSIKDEALANSVPSISSPTSKKPTATPSPTPPQTKPPNPSLQTSTTAPCTSSTSGPSRMPCMPCMPEQAVSCAPTTVSTTLTAAKTAIPSTTFSKQNSGIKGLW